MQAQLQLPKRYKYAAIEFFWDIAIAYRWLESSYWRFK
jgi:hypothetical protein